MTTTRDPASRVSGPGDDAADACAAVLGLQDDDGAWRGSADQATGADVECVLVRGFLGSTTGRRAQAAVRSVRSRQRPDGSWPGRSGAGEGVASAAGAGDSRTQGASIDAYLALRVAGDPPDAYHLALAAGWIRDAGGIAAAPASTRLWLAMFGAADWDDLPVPAPEAVFRPAWCQPDAGEWAANPAPVLAAVAVIGALRPARRLGSCLAELGLPQRRTGQPAQRGHLVLGRVARACRLHALWTLPLSAARGAALRRCGECVASQATPGIYRAGLAWSVIALRLLGYPDDDPVLAGGLQVLDDAAAGGRHRAPGRTFAVRDTALAIDALADAGLAAAHPAVVAAAEWLIGRQVPVGGLPPSVSRASALAGWSFGETSYADLGDTAEVVRLLGRVRLPAGADGSAVSRAVSWLVRAQHADGGWDRHVGARQPKLTAIASLTGLPEVAVPSSAAVTAAAVHALAAAGLPGCRSVRRGVAWLLRAQRPDGAWPGCYGAGTTGADVVLPALIAAGVQPGKQVVRRAAGWLAGRQNTDGGWPSVPGGSSTVPDTARALAALLAAGGVPESISRGVAWLAPAVLSGDGPAGDVLAGDGLSGQLARLRAAAICARSARLGPAGRQ